MLQKQIFTIEEFKEAKQNLIEQIGKPKVPYDYILGKDTLL